MTSALKIKQVADASGFTATTLRYYEEIGLLPASARTPAGYRTYGEGTLERLAFIARAKQLGCSLDEITGLTTAWEGGRCGPVQDQLRALVADKLAAAERQIAELTTFVGDLGRAAASLEGHRPDGACDATCGCVGEPAPDASEASASEPVRQAVLLSAKPPAAAATPPIACTLTSSEIGDRVADWQALLAHVEEREPVLGGLRVLFAASVPADRLMVLVAAEQQCCRFFDFTITVDARGIALEVRAPAEALPIVESLFGVPA